MQLTDLQMLSYRRDGLLLTERLFSPDEVRLLHGEIEDLSRRPLESHLLEGDGQTMRALHGCDQQSDVMERLVRDRRLLSAAEQMLGEPVYLYQFKVSMKQAFEGDVWRWHQDFTFWHFNDGLRESRAVTAAIFLNPVTEFNAPILLIPGTQDEPLLSCRGFSRDAQLAPGSPEWHENVVANFKYTTTDDEVRRLAGKNGVISAKGDAGTVLFFHSSMLHASTWNISPWPRTSILITYNAVSNRPSTTVPRRDGQRPDFLVATRTDPLTPLDGLVFQSRRQDTLVGDEGDANRRAGCPV